ncbi:MAG: hypothetical protein IT209_08125 [Armatimonadetes bacterium]|nr:hypothetical protein [Armatimonadota bacterium]
MSAEVFQELKSVLAGRALPRIRPPYSPDEEFCVRVTEIPAADLFDVRDPCPEFAEATVAGLLLWADCLEESHRVSQGISNSTGSYWHGIMHRREPDYGNSLYWFRRTGDHPAFATVHRHVVEKLRRDSNSESQILAKTVEEWARWIPERFVALCERATLTHVQEVRALEIAQAAEIEALLDWTYAQTAAPQT